MINNHLFFAYFSAEIIIEINEFKYVKIEFKN